MLAVENWYYNRHGNPIGPATMQQMESLARSGEITRDTLVWPGTGEWVPAIFSELAPAFAPVSVAESRSGLSTSFVRRSRLTSKADRVWFSVTGLALGACALVAGVRQLRDGFGFANGSTVATIQYRGCVGIAADSIRCAYQNIGTARGKLCLDLVVVCDDGRHVASTCSDPMGPGEGSTKVVSNFAPPVRATNVCTALVHENARVR